MIIRHSARKHGIPDEDIVTAVGSPILSGSLDDENPQRILILGFDTHGRVIELVVLVHDDGTEEAIHAMKARKKYLDLIP
ncbi:hypothetical protein [Arthrobacter sp. H14]|uniref:hypothetical protein n=1 Tax=Arthrobacter sp. H14 TaxID=1312959 RepID=UPI00047CCD25|nr:hypothetical protein [Arthrobacter sp. H14]